MNRQRSGFRSMSGVPSRQSRPWTRSVGPFALDQSDQRRADRVRADRRAQRKRAARRAVVGRALAHEIAAGFVQPIKHLDPLERLDPVQRRDPGLGDFDAADRPVGSPLARTFEARGPGRADDSDEGEPGVERRGRFDRDLVSPDFVQPDHDPTHPSASRGLVAARFCLNRLAALADRQSISDPCISLASRFHAWPGRVEWRRYAMDHIARQNNAAPR